MKNMPLKGIRVIDISHSWAGPHCSRILADFGAEVIKVEYPKRLCMLRGGRTDNRAYNDHNAWSQVNRNKYSITLDVTIKKDSEILRDLIKISDVLVDNARTGVMEKLGFGYEDVKKIKPDLIMLSMAAFGKTGPYAAYAGYGAVMEAMGGIQSLTAYSKDAAPKRIKELDVTNGTAGASAVMTALLYRQRTGEGQYIDLSQLEAATHSLIGEHLLEYVMNGTRTLPLGNRHSQFAPQGCYRCKGDDEWIALTVRSDEEWIKLCKALDHPEWGSNASFATAEARVGNHDELDRMIEEWTINHTHYDAVQILQDQGIPSGAVLNTAELSEDQHLKDREYFVKGAGGSDKLFMGVPFKLSEGSGKIRLRGPDLGQHNEYVLCELLGRSKNDVEPLMENAIGTAYDPD